MNHEFAYFVRAARSRISSLAVCLIASAHSLTVSLDAAEAGAWETFLSQANADAWSVYDYSDEQVYFPRWSDAVPGEEDIYFYHTGDEPLWFFTGVEDPAGGGVLVGDFSADDIQGIRCDMEIDSLNSFDFVDCVVFATGPAGRTYYYSTSYTDGDFSESGWWNLSFFFDEDWYYFDGNAYVAVSVTQELLSSVEEIGFRFFPKVGTTTSVFTALDNVQLIPKVAPVEIMHSTSPTHYQLSFTPGNGIACAIEEFRETPSVGWDQVDGQDEITGSAQYDFTLPLAEGVGIFRVKSSAYYTPFVTQAGP